ncbi:TadE/TadG family type IV pilus assembly protein [Altererythrobacter sp. MF3-039]|uniref:TadE/TadG family type IV pilus assembly protein n=1 Tax=Altererythrobacter sp. MF3-039 TaxID=3252901 RepID=UPI00390C7B54
MITRLKPFHAIKRDENGSLGFEFAIALPILVTLMLGILQFAMVLHASGAMRNAMGEGLRLAKVNPTATAAEVTDETKDEFVGVAHSGIKKLVFTRGTSTNGASFGKMVMQYELQPLLPFAPIPPIVINEEKQIYLQAGL